MKVSFSTIFLALHARLHSEMLEGKI